MYLAYRIFKNCIRQKIYLCSVELEPVDKVPVSNSRPPQVASTKHLFINSGLIHCKVLYSFYDNSSENKKYNVLSAKKKNVIFSNTILANIFLNKALNCTD
jgi:hypothetical protein